MPAHECEGIPMKPLLLNPDVADLAPNGDELTVYDEEHTVTHCRMLDAETAGADWREVARIFLHIDPEAEGERARPPGIRQPPVAREMDFAMGL
jgi:hypothetical protein